ncbi:MAG: efflux RND transporter permease subunit [Aestuariibacter sp.]
MASYQQSPWYTVFYNNGHLLLLSIVILLVAGLSALTNLPRLEDPRIDTRNVLALTTFPGASADRVEALVTDVIEDELRQLYEIKDIRSTSRAGVSVVNIELQAWVDKTTNEEIFSKIRDRLAEAANRFPAGAGQPTLDTQRGATAFTLKVALQINNPSSLQDFGIVTRLSEELSDRLRNVAGTEIVRSYGELDEEVQVIIDPQELINSGLTVQQAAAAIAANDPKSPAGLVRSESQNTRIQVAQELTTLDAVRQTPINSASSAYLRIGDIAEVRRGWREPVQDVALLNGQRVVFVAARMQTTVRVDAWMQSALQVVDTFTQEFAGTVTTQVVFDQSQYTEQRLSDLSQNLILGSVVVMAVVLLFMGYRAAWIVGLSLPLSAAFAIFSLAFYGQQIHQMSIFGIIVAIGLLIDNAIVITDEIRANLQEASRTRLQALVKSLRHLFVPLLASTLTTILGFMPIFLLPGNIGDFVSPIAISVVMALIGSLFISLTVIAALAARFLPRRSGNQQHWIKSGVQMPAITQLFKRQLTRAVSNPKKLIWLPILLPILGFGLSSQLGNVFFPSADRDQFEIYLWMPSGTGIAETQKAALKADQMIRQKATVEQVAWLVGGSIPSVYYNQVMTRDNSPHFAQAVVTTDSVDSAAALVSDLQFALNTALPDAKLVVRPFGQGPPISAPVGVDIIGPDIQVLHRLGEQVRLAMSHVPGITQSIASINMEEPELILQADHDALSLASLRYQDVAQQLQTSLEGHIGGSILEGTEDIAIRVKVANTRKQDITQLSSFPLLSNKLAAQQSWLPLSAVGEFELQPSIGGITREDGMRVNHVEAFILPNATAIDVSNAVAAQLQKGAIQLPEGYRIKMKGDADKQQEALGQLATYAPVLLVLMLATLILSFNSFRLAAVIGAVAVLSVGLGFFSLWLSGLPVGFNPILGSAGLIGVAINGSIVVIAAIKADPRARRGEPEAVVEATMGCSRHILSTTVTTVGGFIPLLLFSEGTFWPPLAVVLAGGVGFSIILSLLFTPVVVAWLARRRSKKQLQYSTVSNSAELLPE